MLNSGSDDYAYDDDGFEDYDAKTTEPGPWLLIAVLSYSVLCILLLPVLVVIERKRQLRRVDKSRWNDATAPDYDGSIISEGSSLREEGFEVEINTTTDDFAIIDVTKGVQVKGSRRKLPTPLDLDHDVRPKCMIFLIFHVVL